MLAHPQIVARQFIREVESPVGKVPIVGSPLRMSRSAARYERIPELGADTEAILRELGYDDKAVESFRRGRVI